MANPLRSEGPPSLLGITTRRSLVSGRIYLAFGTGYALVLATVMNLTSSSSFGIVFTLFLPLFAAVGSLGGLIVFTNDRIKGVFEYLIAYGISPRQLFVSVLVGTLVLVSLVLGISISVELSLYVATGHTISALLAEGLGLYSLPMSYASAAFATIAGMFWTSLSSPRAGINSPIGLVPLIGIAPTFIVIAAVAVVGSTYVLFVGVAVLAVVVLSLLSLIGRLMPRERLLSPV